MSWKIGIGVVVLIVLVLVVFDGMFIVKPDQFALVTEFGDPVRVIYDERCADTPEELAATNGECTRKEVVPAPGLYFKMPLSQDVRYMDARVRNWYDEGNDTKTVELRTIDFEAFARWRIVDPLRYYTAARTDQRVMAGMDSIVTARIQSVVSEHSLASIVRDRGRRFSLRAKLDLSALIADYEECKPQKNAAIQRLIDEAEDATKERDKGFEDQPALRSEIVKSIQDWANEQLEAQFGIHILDLHFRRLNYSSQIRESMVLAIAADRQRDIAAYNKVGTVCKGSIDQVKTRRRGEIDGEKEQEVRELLGSAQAEAIRTKAEAFGQDPSFFQFLKTLEVYERSFTDKTSLV
ncbi:MAG: hypothetical protein KC766_42330, partial [Myxococcales bacterium]|nr:hypothetical protein [Myxococcales bacterium]